MSESVSADCRMNAEGSCIMPSGVDTGCSVSMWSLEENILYGKVENQYGAVGVTKFGIVKNGLIVKAIIVQ